MEARAEAKGDPYLQERFRRGAVDDAVVAYAERMQTPSWNPTKADFLVRVMHHNRFAEPEELKFLRMFAGERLTLLHKPEPATLAEYKERGLANEIERMEQYYSRVAPAYSFVLGREIKPSELVTEAELRR